jgi:chromosomal replication initiator protein
MLQQSPQKTISVEEILKCVATTFQVKVTDLKGSIRTKDIAFPRQVAMYLAKELIKTESLAMLGAYFGKTHSTLIHAHKNITQQLPKNQMLARQIDMIKRNL